jgi:RNA polymerase-binding transcription factor DksA
MAKRKKAAVRRKKAATEDVVGQVQAEFSVRPKWRSHYKRLTSLRDQLLSRQGTLNKDALEEQPTFSTHMADAATDTYDRDFALGMLSSDQDALYEIEEAINRIRDGSYGICELTGKTIEPKRLEVIPWTRFTAAAEKQLEKDGAVKRARLGPRDTVGRVEPTSDEDGFGE